MEIQCDEPTCQRWYHTDNVEFVCKRCRQPTTRPGHITLYFRCASGGKMEGLSVPPTRTWLDVIKWCRITWSLDAVPDVELLHDRTQTQIDWTAKDNGRATFVWPSVHNSNIPPPDTIKDGDTLTIVCRYGSSSPGRGR